MFWKIWILGHARERASTLAQLALAETSSDHHRRTLIFNDQLGRTLNPKLQRPDCQPILLANKPAGVSLIGGLDLPTRNAKLDNVVFLR